MRLACNCTEDPGDRATGPGAWPTNGASTWQRLRAARPPWENPSTSHNPPRPSTPRRAATCAPPSTGSAPKPWRTATTRGPPTTRSRSAGTRTRGGGEPRAAARLGSDRRAVRGTGMLLVRCTSRAWRGQCGHRPRTVRSPHPRHRGLRLPWLRCGAAPAGPRPAVGRWVSPRDWPGDRWPMHYCWSASRGKLVTAVNKICISASNTSGNTC